MAVRFGGGAREVIRGLFPRKSRPYAEIAGIYDRIMSHVNYLEWAQYLAEVFDRFHPGVRTVLETACGTGNLALLLHTMGYRLTCTDISPEMLGIAARKFRRAGAAIPAAVADMAFMPVRPRFDAVICMYDSMNYLTTPGKFRAAIRNAAGVLGPGGIFVFDVCTVRNSELFFRDGSVTETIAGVEYERVCRYDPVERIQENRFTIIRSGDSQIREVHRQRIYLLDEVEEMIAGAPFSVQGRFDDMTFRSGDERSERVHYVLRREEPEMGGTG